MERQFVIIRNMSAELQQEEFNKDVFVVEFGGEYQLQISKIDGVYKVTNGVNGYGFNCKEEFKETEVLILSTQN